MWLKGKVQEFNVILKFQTFQSFHRYAMFEPFQTFTRQIPDPATLSLSQKIL
jgi:hypothetical protein